MVVPRIARPKFDCKFFYHILNRGNNKNRIFLSNEDKYFFSNKFLMLTEQYPIFVDSFCIMDNHFHLEVMPYHEDDIPKLMQCLCTSYALYYNKKYERIGHVFQDRYKSKCIQTSQGVLNVRRYIQNNPVKEDIVDRPENYKWLWSLGIRPWPGTVPDLASGFLR
jgi:REP element-mobilizing transposase RayT